MVEINLESQSETREQKLVEQYIALNSEHKRLTALAEERKKELEIVEAELLELLNDENKKSSGRYKGVGHVTCLEPSVGNAYILDGQKEVLFDFLRQMGREDLIKVSVHHTSLAAFINQRLKSGLDAPPGCDYKLVQKLRPYPDKTT